MKLASELTLHSIVVVSKDQVSCEIQDETVLLSLSNGEYFGLNSVGSTIWRLIQTPRTIGELRDALLDEYSGISPEACEEEILSFLQQTIALELVETSYERARVASL